MTEPILIYTGSLITLTLALVGPSTVTTAKDIIMMLVGLATFIYTILKIIELRAELKKERMKAKHEHEQFLNEKEKN